MQLIFNMNQCVDGGESASAGDELLAEPSYHWMCGVCSEKPKFETIHELFEHKLKVHLVKYDSSFVAQDTSDKVFTDCPQWYSTESRDVEAPQSPDFTSDEDDNVPLSQLKQALKPLKIKIKIKRKKRRKPQKGGSEKVEQENEPLVEYPTEEPKENEVIKFEEIEFDEEFSWGSPLDESQVNSEEGEGGTKKNVNHVCKICNEAFAARAHLSRHKSTHICPETGAYKCDACGKLCPQYDNFTRHLATHLENRPKEFHCDQCFSAFFNKADLKRHAVLHMDVKPFMCDECNEGFTRQDALLIHKAKHTGVPYTKYTCKLCGKVLNSPSALTMHCKNHTKKSVFCQEPGCQFSCYLKSQLRQHIRTHSGEKPFQCAQCGRCFARSNDMRNHVLNVHQRFRPHACPECPKAFTLLSSLKTHRLAHLDVRPYLCAECGKRFNHPSTLRKHTQFLHCAAGKRSSKTTKKEPQSKMYADVGVQSMPMPLAPADTMPLAPADTMPGSGLLVPVTIHIPHIPNITVSIEHGYPQSYVIPAVSIS